MSFKVLNNILTTVKLYVNNKPTKHCEKARLHMYRLSQDPRASFTPWQRGCLNYYSNPENKWTQDTVYFLEHIIQNLNQLSQNNTNNNINNNANQNFVFGSDKANVNSNNTILDTFIEPVIHTTPSGMYIWKLAGDDGIEFSVDTTLYNTLKETQHQADGFIKSLGNLDSTQGRLNWLRIGLEKWKNNVKNSQTCSSRLQILQVLDQPYLVIIEKNPNINSTNTLLDRVFYKKFLKSKANHYTQNIIQHAPEVNPSLIARGRVGPKRAQTYFWVYPFQTKQFHTNLIKLQNILF